MTSHTRRGERGYAMAALLVAMAVMAIASDTALPVFTTAAKREREAELAFRGEQYARAIGRFQQKYANALPPSLDVLVNERFLRKRYKDPITGGDFQLLGPNSPELAAAAATPPQQAQQGQQGQQGTGRSSAFSTAGRGTPQTSTGFGTQQSTSQFQTGGRGGTQTSAGGQTQTGLSALARETQAGQAPGGIIAVASKSTDTSMRLYNGKNKYNEWVFMALQASTVAGAPPGSGGQTPGGRGGEPGGGLPGGRGGVGGRGSPAIPQSPRGGGGFTGGSPR